MGLFQSKRFISLGRLLGRRGALWLVAAIAASLFTIAVELGLALFLQLFLKSIGLTIDVPRQFSMVTSWTPSLAQASFLLILLGCGRFVCQFISTQASITAMETIHARFRRLAVFDMLIKRRSEVVSATEMNTRFSELFPKAAFFVLYATSFLSFAIQAICLFGILLYMSLPEAIIGLLCLGSLGTLVTLANRRIRHYGASLPAEQLKLIEGIQRVAYNWLLIRVLRAARFEHSVLASSIDRYQHNSQMTWLLTNLIGAATPLTGIVIVVILIISSQTYFHTPVSVLLSFLYLFLRTVQILANTFSNLGQCNQFWLQFSTAARYLLSFTPQEMHEALARQSGDGRVQSAETGKDHSKTQAPAITLADVAYRYPSMDTYLFEKLSLNVPQGSVLGIIGPSGSGKSTLLSLIFGEIEPNKGSISINDLPPREYWDRNTMDIAFVGVQPYLVAGTIRQNLLYGGSKDRSEDELWQSLKTASADGFVRALPLGLDHYIPETGDGLSAGQKQRLSLARAFARQPKILILDEATANLDNETEASIVESIKVHFVSKVTTIIVSHRPSMLTFADHVLDLSAFSKRVTVDSLSR